MCPYLRLALVYCRFRSIGCCFSGVAFVHVDLGIDMSTQVLPPVEGHWTASHWTWVPFVTFTLGLDRWVTHSLLRHQERGGGEVLSQFHSCFER